MEQLTKNQAVATSQEAVQNQNEPQLRDENAHNDKSVHGVLNPTYQAGLRRDASNIQTGAERMPHDLSHLGFLAGQIGRLITISTTPVIAGDSFEMDAVGALRLSPLRRGLAIDSTVDIFTFY